MAFEVTTAGNELVYLASETSWYNQSIAVDTTHVLNFWRDGGTGNGHAQIFEIDGSYDVTAKGSSLNFDTSLKTNSIAQVDETHFLNFWQGASDDGFAQIFNVNTSTWAVTALGTALEFDTSNASFNGCVEVDHTHYINFWEESSNGYAQVFEVNTSTWVVSAAGDKFNFRAAASRYMKCLKIDSTHILVVFRTFDSTWQNWAQVMEVNTSTWEISAAGSAFSFGAGADGWNSINQVDLNHFIVFWADGDGDGQAQILEVNTSTWAVTAPASALEYDTANGTHNFSVQADATHFLNFWAGSGNDGFAQVFEVNTSTWEITAQDTALEYDTINGVYPSCSRLDLGYFINFWSGSDRADDAGIARVFNIDGLSGDVDVSATTDSSTFSLPVSHIINFIQLINWTIFTILSTNWEKVVSIVTNWVKTTINSTGWTKSSTNDTGWS